MYKVAVDRDTCEGCGECAENCPVTMFEMVDGKAQVTGDMEECLGCETCVSVCPSGAVNLEEA